MTDTSGTMVIRYSPEKIIGPVGLGVLMTALSVWVTLPTGAPIFVRLVGGYFGTIPRLCENAKN
jgi:hypothetical protein